MILDLATTGETIDHQALVEFLCARHPKRVRAAKEQWEQRHDESLVDLLADSLGEGDMKRLALTLLKGRRDVDEEVGWGGRGAGRTGHARAWPSLPGTPRRTTRAARWHTPPHNACCPLAHPAAQRVLPGARKVVPRPQAPAQPHCACLRLSLAQTRSGAFALWRIHALAHSRSGAITLW